MRRGVGIALCAGLAACAVPACGQTLRVAVSSPVTSIDPHYHNLAPNISLSSQIFNRLVEMDEHAHLVPGLAETWKLVAPDTWELRLRDTKFQNGNDFVADDVVFTIDRIPKVPNSPSNFAAYTKPITSTEIVDPHTIRLHTNGVFPLLPTYLAQFFIINRKSDEGMATEDFNSGKAAIGTGPFRFVSFKPGDRVELERNDGYWGPKAGWQHVDYRFIANDASRTAALLADDVDFIDFVPTEDLEKLRKDPKVKLWEALGLRLIFLGLDHSRDGPSPFVFGPNGEKLDKNPLKDRRVRLALSIAINRQAIVDRVMEGAAVPSGQYLPPGVLQQRAGPQAAAVRPGAGEEAAGGGGLSQGSPHCAARTERPLRERCEDHPGDRPDVDAHRRADRSRSAAVEQLCRSGQQAGVLCLPVWLGHRNGRGIRPADRAECHVQFDQGLGRVESRTLFQSGAGQADRAGRGHRG